MAILFGTEAAENLTGIFENDILYGSDGDDFLFGDAGDDYLSGDAGSNTLDGGTGRDVLTGSGGNEMLAGGEGADCFYFIGPAMGVAAITDFELAEDFILLSADSFGVSDLSQFSYISNYNNNMGALVFDSNGTAPGGEMLVAELAPGLGIDNTNMSDYVCLTNNISGNAVGFWA
jgi:Ca2+-binding RTX toxin-like protein